MMNAGREGAPRRVLIVSFGSAGQRHLRSVMSETPGCEIALLRRVAEDAQPDGVTTVLTTMAEATAWRPDVAVIASPAPLHADTAIALAKAGADLLIEKPLAHSLDAGRRMVDEVRKNNVFAVIGYTLRSSSWLQSVREVVASGRLGRCLGARLSVGQALPGWRPGRDYRETVTAKSSLGGGALLELSHEIDAACWLFGPPHAVQAVVCRVSNLDIDVEDLAELTLLYKTQDQRSGPVVTIHLDLFRPIPQRTIEVWGEQAVLNACALTGRIAISNADGESEVCTPCPINSDRLFRNQWLTFLQDRQSRKSSLASVDDGLNTLAIVESARRSSDECRRVVLS